MKSLSIQLTSEELTELARAYQTIRSILEKVVSPNELYREKFLKGLQESNAEVESGEFEEVKNFDDFIR